MAKVFGAKLISGVKFLTLLIIIYNFNFCAATEIGKIELRHKRQTPTDLKNQYQSVPQNVTYTKQQLTSQQNQPNGSTERSLAETSIVVPYNPDDRPLLGVNGTGQRKDMSNKQVKPTVVSDPIQPATAEDTAKKPNQFPKKVLGTAFANSDAGQSTETPEEKVVDNIDVPENETLNVLQKQNLTVNQTTDYHNYYNSTIYINKEEADQIWTTIKNITPNSMLSQSHRRAMTIELSFDFPFYGHPVRNVTVATGGFLYMGEYVHSWLAATQYIAPLMANFDTSLSNDSFVRLQDNGTTFTAIWENVSLQDKQDVGKFTFSTTLHKNGDIVFTYFSVPIFINAIQDNKHPVKVGLSDAYIIDKVVYFARRKTIYEYHRVNFASSEITNATIIYLTALPTCPGYTDCVSCINHETTFDCAWCPVLHRCSTGTDRKKQSWLNSGCDHALITNTSACPAIGQKGNNANQTSSVEPSITKSTNSSNLDDRLHNSHTNDSESATITPANVNAVNKEMKAALNDQSDPKSMGLALSFFVPICVVLTVMLWVLYAYRNPHTKSGQLLIQYRPSQWSWRRGEARYTAATIHM